ncbi:MAG: ABC transporter ATP-binding protein, partial [Burkholderiaceae bacterium]
MSANALAIDVQGLNKHFGDRHVVRDLSLQVREGEIFGFLGPNGSGKTTSIRLICGLLTPDSGQGTCLGFDVRSESAAIKREVGYMTQRFSLWEDLSIAENLDFVARLFDMSDRRQAVERALDDLGLSGRRHQLAGTLSGGWKQRLALAACLLHQPRLLLLDEPTAGVDPKARRDFWEELHRLSADGITVLVSTHYMDEAERCHRLGYIAYGQLLASGTAQQIIAAQRLHTWELRGEDLHGLATALQQLPGAEQVASFGAVLHVSGRDGPPLEAALRRFSEQRALQLRPIEPSLEDAFIHLMQQADDPLQPARRGAAAPPAGT